MLSPASKSLMDTLLSQSLLSESLISEITKDADYSKKTVEDIIHERQLVKDSSIAEIKSKILGIPYKKVEIGTITDELLKTISEESAINYKVIPLSQSPDLLIVGMLYPDDEEAQEALRFIAKREKHDLGVYLIARDDFDLVLRRYNPYANEITSAIQFIKPTEKSARQRRIVKLEEGTSVTEEAPIIKIVASTLREAVIQKASDIHIEPQRNRLRVRFRIDGDLHEITSMPIELHQPIISRVKVLSELLIDETRRPQDGRFRTILLGRDIDFRVATFPTPAGEKVALRVLDPTVGLKGLPDLGLVEANLDMISAGLNKPFGMILITGPTGSGKTTTLYALMQILNKEEVNIVSLEDPVEYFVDGLNQSQVRPDIGYDFASGLRQILRQDPDIIMVGEIRDSETAGLAVHAALTGHIVLSTLHTNNSVGVLPRLKDMGVDTFLLPSAVNLMAAQRLVSRLCAFCKESAVPEADMLAIIENEVAKMSPALKALIPPPYQIYHSAGCVKCKNKGFMGRVALFEVFQMTKELTEIISAGLNENKILGEARRQGMMTLREDGIIKALQGQVSMEEVLRETSES